MNCYKCKAKVELINNKVGFRAACESCSADLHVCVNCKYYSIGKPNNCLVPNTEYVQDREKNNFCEDFFPLNTLKEEPKKRKQDIAQKLFKDDDDDTGDSSFDSLFKN